MHSQRQASGKKPGAQPGHPGHHLEMADQPEVIKNFLIERCVYCQAPLSELEVEGGEKRQVYDLPK